MQLPTWLKPALLGAGAGAIALAIVGFSWGGWVTGGSAKDMATKQSNVAVAAALTPYCVERAGGMDAATATTLTELKAATTYSRKGIVEKAGKKKMRQFGSVEIPQEAFIKALKMGDE
jgi:hypothetical protein